jgi:hypothetical protein
MLSILTEILSAVALFNAVRMQQKGETDRSSASVAKKAGFLDMLSSKAKVVSDLTH